MKFSFMEYGPQRYTKSNVFTEFKDAQGKQNHLSGPLLKKDRNLH